MVLCQVAPRLYEFRTSAMPSNSRSLAIVPAAGRSQRMGDDKLLLPWGESTVLGLVLAAWQASQVDEVVVVTRGDREDIMNLCETQAVTVVMPELPPLEMKDSVLAALQCSSGDVWLLAPADMPKLNSAIIDQVLAAHDPDLPEIIAPVESGKRGHPVLFPWRLAAEVASLAPDEGVNAILKRHRVREIKCQDAAIHDDIDTPEDYKRGLS